MHRNASLVRFILLIAVVVVLAALLGGDPWGPV